jgi:hypothetical protein
MNLLCFVLLIGSGLSSLLPYQYFKNVYFQQQNITSAVSSFSGERLIISKLDGDILSCILKGHSCDKYLSTEEKNYLFGNDNQLVVLNTKNLTVVDREYLWERKSFNLGFEKINFGIMLNPKTLVTSNKNNLTAIKIPTSFTNIQNLYDHDDTVISLLKLSNGMLASGSDDTTIKLRDPKDNYKVVRTIETGSKVYPLLQLSNGMLVSGHHDNSFKV